MYVCICVCMYICIYVHVCVYECIFIYVSMHMYAYACMYVCTNSNASSDLQPPTCEDNNGGGVTYHLVGSAVAFGRDFFLLSGNGGELRKGIVDM